MTKHRTITGFVAVALLAVAASAATIKSHPPGSDRIAVSGTTSKADRLPAADFNDRWSALSPTTETAPDVR
ncbi:hypothetical protein JQ604_36145 [Bradyrhizobium jicamae]|uniref:hypothetical protein n=1 Tax=Bradyrhizobium jicamae TaxID=280332 RepID=UPI001BAB03F4|nr:hypothetical protein [Bradyrhizobium jicamae]MBR0757640.1 hypothetical protein [Bradyrhizobium jicamae]